MFTIVFVGTARRPLDVAELAEMLLAYRHVHEARGITGVIAFQDGNVLGVLEGDEDAVRTRLAELDRDPRYAHVHRLVTEAAADRSFADWRTAFRTSDPALQDLRGFSDLFTLPSRRSPAERQTRGTALLDWFRRHPLAPPEESTLSSSNEPRALLVRAAVTVITRTGLDGFEATLVADEAGFPLSTLAEHFPTRQSLLTATVDWWSGTVSRPLTRIAEEEGAVPYLRALVVAYAAKPALMRLIAGALAGSGDPGNDGGEYYQTVYLRFRRIIRDALAADVRIGREPATMNPAVGAELLLALYDGLRTQALMVPGFDIESAFDRSVSMVRLGWSA